MASSLSLSPSGSGSTSSSSVVVLSTSSGSGSESDGENNSHKADAAAATPAGGRGGGRSTTTKRGKKSSSGPGGHQEGSDHRRGLPLKCEECSAVFWDPMAMQIHERVHTGERPYLCQKCGERFIAYQYLLKHREKLPRCRLMPRGQKPSQLKGKGATSKKDN